MSLTGRPSIVPSNAASSFFRAVESDLQALSQEARRSLPAVKDAAERVLIELRRASAAVAASGGKLSVLRGSPLMSQVLHPFIFSCNYADAPKKLLTIALSSVQRFVVADVLSSADLANLVRVLEIQVSVFGVYGWDARLAGAAASSSRRRLLSRLFSPSPPLSVLPCSLPTRRTK